MSSFPSDLLSETSKQTCYCSTELEFCNTFATSSVYRPLRNVTREKKMLIRGILRLREAYLWTDTSIGLCPWIINRTEGQSEKCGMMGDLLWEPVKAVPWYQQLSFSLVRVHLGTSSWDSDWLAKSQENNNRQNLAPQDGYHNLGLAGI